nr:S-layer homology domain-containing protein [Lachnospiraceae bacterium]
SSDDFGVGEWVTRQDMALMLMRYSEYKGYKRAIDFGRTDDYTDYYDIDQYAWEAVTWAVTWNIMSGKGEPGSTKEEQKFDPHGKVTRGEFEETLKSMLAVNGVSAPAVIPVPDMSDTGKDSAEADAQDTDDNGTDLAEQGNEAAVSDDEADTEAAISDDEAATASSDDDGSSASDTGDNNNDNNGATDENSTVASDKKMSPLIIILIVLGLGVAGFVGYRIVKKKGN